MKRRLFRRLMIAAAIAAAVLSGVTSALAAFNPGDGTGNGTKVRTSVVAGRAYLITQQNQGGPGCWTSQFFTTGVTALAVLALVNSEQGGYASLDGTTKAAVDAGTTCLMAHFVPGPGPTEGTFQDCPGCEFQTYNTSITIWALSNVPSTLAISSAIAAGRQWLIDNQRNASDPAGRADTGGNVNNGGWFYHGGTAALFVEHSNSSFALQGLAATGGIPAATADLAQGFWKCLQRLTPYPVPGCSTGGGPFNDGGYIYSHEANKGGTETSATGSGSFSMSLTGVPNGDPRIAATIEYLDASIGVSPCENNTHVVDGLGTGWFGSGTLRHYAVWANFKAHELAGIADSVSDQNNYYYKLANCLVTEQALDGGWPGSSASREDRILATAFSMLTLEKVTPEAPISNAQGVPFSATEGALSCGPVATFQDGDNAAKPSDYGVTIDWGDGTTSPGNVSSSNGTFTVSGCHTYAEEGSSYKITVTIVDVDNKSNTATVTTTANVVDAALASSCAMPTTTSQSYTGPTATFNDLVTPPAGTPDDFSATISWGDGLSSVGAIAGGPSNVPYTVSGSHVYSSTGFFTVTTTINDVGGSSTTATCSSVLIFAFSPGGGSFVIGDLESAPGTQVEFWGAQWWKNNPTSTGSKVASFKGFAESPATPSCGVGWSADPGNSTPPPNGPLPAYMAVIVTSSYSKSGSTISGDTVHIVVVKTDAGYQPNPGHPGTGTVVQQAC